MKGSKESWREKKSIVQTNLQAVACLPLNGIASDLESPDLLGILYLDSTQAMHALPGLDQRILSKLAAESGNVLEKLELIQSVEERKRFEQELAVALVTPEWTAERFGNPGVKVLATPALIALLEETAIGCIASTLVPGQGSVGTRIDVQHLAATPVGMKVVGHAELIEVDGRRLVFKVEARASISSGHI